jgi:hypothetical protein
MNNKKYLNVFAITVLLFGVIFIISEYLFNTRAAQLKAIGDNINLNILETEIQYALLSDASCEDDADSSILLSEINNLARRLELTERQRGVDDPEVISLKKYYSLLQIKDYLLLRDRARMCGEKPLSILFFYSNKGDCVDCKKMGYLLTSMREDYDDLHIYSFDYHLGLSVIESLKSIYHLSGEVPVVVINRKPYYGYLEKEEIIRLIPELADDENTPASASSSGN